MGFAPGTQVYMCVHARFLLGLRAEQGLVPFPLEQRGYSVK